MQTNKKIKKGSHPVRPSHPVRRLKLPAYYTQVLNKWTRLVKLEKGHGVEQLVNTTTGRAEYRMVINGKLVSLEILDGEDQGRNSFVYLVKTHGFTSEAILKHFMTDSSVSSSSVGETKEPYSERQHTYRTEPIVEARLQKYAHVHGLAPAVFAFNEVAMISEKCFAVNFKVPQCSQPRQFGKGVKVGKEMRWRQRADSILQASFNEQTKKVLKLINTMYQDTGMYNTDPNEGNYMLDGNDKLIQIDYGGNRFDKKESFDTFANGFVKSIGKRMDLQEQLLFDDGTKYPPYYYWFTQKLGGTTIQKMLKLPSDTKLKGMNKREWEGMFIELMDELDKNCNRIKILEEDNDTSDKTAFFVQHIVRKF